ncbi:MAG TPA: tetratricopeptide repeat protein [Anaerolineae bacterium]|nr:tetratricopeptide repeat protein [Anaerolineae bacterium]
MKRSFFAFALIGLALLAGLVFTVQSSSSTAQTNAQAVTAANKLVNAGHYAEAAQMYEQLLAGSPQDAALHYNLGNARFLQGDVTAALAAYERAAALAPRDTDIRANLALAQQTLGQTGSPSTSPAVALADAVGRWLTVDEGALLALGAWCMLGLLVFVRRARSIGASHPV